MYTVSYESFLTLTDLKYRQKNVMAWKVIVVSTSDLLSKFKYVMIFYQEFIVSFWKSFVAY